MFSALEYLSSVDICFVIRLGLVIIFFIFLFGSYPVTFKDNSWLCTHELLLAVFRDPKGC